MMPEGQAMKTSYDPEADAAYLTLSDRPVREAEEVAPNVILHFDEDNRIAGIEILFASETLARGATASLAKLARPAAAWISPTPRASARRRPSQKASPRATSRERGFDYRGCSKSQSRNALRSSVIAKLFGKIRP